MLAFGRLGLKCDKDNKERSPGTAGFDIKIIILSWRIKFRNCKIRVSGYVSMQWWFPQEPLSVQREPQSRQH